MGTLDTEKAKAIALAQAQALAAQQSKHYAFDGSNVPGYDPATGNMQPGVVEDMAKAAPSYFARGAADLVGLPGTIGDALNSGGEWALRKGYEGVTGQEPSPQGGAAERFFAGPTPEVNAAMIGGGQNPLGGANLKADLSAATSGATDYQAQTTPGKYTGAVSEFLPGAMAFGSASLPGIVKNAVIPAVVSETAGETAQKYAPGLEPYARVAGALAGGAAGSKIGGAATKMPTAAEIKQSAGYADLKAPMQAARINQETYSGIVNDLKTVAKDFGTDPTLHGGIETTLLRYAQKAKRGGASMQDLEVLRRSLANGGKNPLNPSAGELSHQLIKRLDENVDKISGSNVVAAEGQAADQTLSALKDAREIYRTGSKAAIVEKAMEKAKNAASGGENGLRIEFRKILDKEHLSRQFTPTERLAIQQVANGTFKGNMLRLIGGFGVPIDNARNFLGSVIGGGVGSSAGAAIGSLIGGPVLGAGIGSVLLPAIGTAAKFGANSVTKNNAAITEALVKAGPKASDAFAEALRLNQSGGREAILRALLQGQSAAQVQSAREHARR